ncbi:MAG: Rieske 2Fe-2S domain-containing protein [Acidimicrobiia bacterium]
MAEGSNEDFVVATTLDELWEGEMASVMVNGTAVLLVNLEGGKVVAFEDRCPHVGTPLSDGEFDEGELMCVSHQWTFEAETGAGTNPASSCLKRFAVKIDGDNVLVATGIVEQQPVGLTA